MSTLYEAFLSRLPAEPISSTPAAAPAATRRLSSTAAHVVDAFDASPELASAGQQALRVRSRGADASPRSRRSMPTMASGAARACFTFRRHDMARSPSGGSGAALRPGGCIYLSFKLGVERTHEHDGRSSPMRTIRRCAHWLSRRCPQVASIETWITEDQRPDRSEQWINALVVRAPAPARKLVTGGDDPFLPHLSHAMARATEIDIAVAFIKTTGIRLLMPDLSAALLPPAYRTTRAPHSRPHQRLSRRDRSGGAPLAPAAPGEGRAKSGST